MNKEKIIDFLNKNNAWHKPVTCTEWIKTQLEIASYPYVCFHWNDGMNIYGHQEFVDDNKGSEFSCNIDYRSDWKLYNSEDFTYET